MMITCLKYDDVHNRLWYGTPDSTVSCLSLDHFETSQSQTLNKNYISDSNKSLNKDIEIKGML